MRKIIFLIIALASMSAAARTEKGDYLNPSLPVETRVTDLLGRMTVEEKVGQLLCPLGWEMYSIRSRKHVEVSDTFKSLLKNRCAGMLWAVYRADPWTRKTIDNGLTPRLAAMAGNALQKYTIENTRLGIPMFIAEEAPHGHMAIGATVFPTGIGMAATWNPALIEQTGKVIASEIRSQGAHISYGPVLDLARDPRWSRVEETMGEDPALSGIIGAAMVKGLGGGQIQKPDATIATLKHFLAYAVPEGGQNGNYSTVGTRDLFQYFLPPFRMAVDAGALSIMTSSNSIDGVPCTSNRSLLTDLLRNQWHFRGFTVSDLYSIDGLYETHHVAPTRQDAAMLALRAGVDVDLGADAYLTLVSAVRDGKSASRSSMAPWPLCCVLNLKWDFLRIPMSTRPKLKNSWALPKTRLWHAKWPGSQSRCSKTVAPHSPSICRKPALPLLAPMPTPPIISSATTRLRNPTDASRRS